MLSFAQLWLPVLLSAVFVFIASSLIHMVFKWHNSDYRGFSNEDEIRAAMRKNNPAPGMYLVPKCNDMKEMNTPEMQAKFKEGPLCYVMLRAGAAPSMGKPLTQWFVFCLVVPLLCAFLGGAVIGVGATPMLVFHTIGLAALLGFALSTIPSGIWQGQPWASVAKSCFDGIIFAAITGATFAWLWPK